MAKIISIHSFRGGTGKSNFTANLAVTLANANKSVGIIDTDIQSPGIHIIFQFDQSKNPKTLNDFLKKGIDIEEVFYDVTPKQIVSKGKVYLSPSSMKAKDISIILRDSYDINLLCDGFNRIIKKFNLDFLLIDTHPGLNETTLFSLSFSDVLFLLFRPDQQDFQGTAITLEVANKLEVPKIELVLNKAYPNLDPKIIEERVQTFYKTNLAGVIPFSDEMLEFGSKGLFSLETPNTDYAKVIKNIADNLL